MQTIYEIFIRLSLINRKKVSCNFFVVFALTKIGNANNMQILSGINLYLKKNETGFKKINWSKGINRFKGIKPVKGM